MTPNVSNPQATVQVLCGIAHLGTLGRAADGENIPREESFASAQRLRLDSDNGHTSSPSDRSVALYQPIRKNIVLDPVDCRMIVHDLYRIRTSLSFAQLDLTDATQLFIRTP